MTDLEEKFLKKNIPGKYSKWHEYNDTYESDGDSSADGVSNEKVGNWESKNPTSVVSTRPGTHSTGAKGVLNDYREHTKIEAYQRHIEREEEKKILSRAINGAYLKPGEASISYSSTQQSKNKEQENSDENFLVAYRRKRLLQMKQSHSLPFYGNFSELETALEYAEVIDNTDPRISVIIHIYEPSINECARMNQFLDSLAHDDLKSGTRFCRVRAFTLKDDFDVIGLPVVILYRNSKLIKNWTRVVDYFPMDKRQKFTISDVKSLIEPEIKNGLSLTNKTDYTKEIRCNTFSHVHSESDEYDSEDEELDALCADFTPSLSY